MKKVSLLSGLLTLIVLTGLMVSCGGSAKEIQWSDSPYSLDLEKPLEVGDKVKVKLPPNGGYYSVWGSEYYTADSSIGTAAVHSGLITFEEGGTVTVIMEEGQGNHSGSTKNGITTSSWGSYPLSFRVE